MRERAGRLGFVLILLLFAMTCAVLALLHFHAMAHFIQKPGARMAGLPRVTLWAWQRPEYFAVPSGQKAPYAVAYLDQTITITADGVVGKPRMVSVTFPDGAVRMAVVRIEVSPGVALTKEMLAEATRLLLVSAVRPGIAAFQIDFDARQSERDFYRLLLLRVRATMPPALPLSMTALASWCAYDDWIAALPVDEAVPMFFRMEPEWRYANVASTEYTLREPLCAGSIGLSNRGTWPPIPEGRRIYLFADDGWSPQAVESALRRIQ